MGSTAADESKAGAGDSRKPRDRAAHLKKHKKKVDKINKKIEELWQKDRQQLLNETRGDIKTRKKFEARRAESKAQRAESEPPRPKKDGDRSGARFASLAAAAAGTEPPKRSHEVWKNWKQLTGKDVAFEAIDVPGATLPPALEHGLERVLFSPGVHVLQDERTGVYNFSSYLKKLQSVHSFDFLKIPPYLPSSEDKVLQQITAANQARFTTSTSNVTGVLSQLHYLISRWRPLNLSRVSQLFGDVPTSPGASAAVPVSVFLRYQPDTGVYALDADKTLDSSLLLSHLGKVLELLLTTTPEQFAQYRLEDGGAAAPIEHEREAFHYSRAGSLVMRSQLDCYDRRLPGTGTFDLKTRAVCAVRHDIQHTQANEGTGYQITQMLGPYESYEREYVDLVRLAFLKYSLQARIGRMDGIFLAYHNIERLFGFQYVPLAEMDECIHGVHGERIAQDEFAISLRILEDVLAGAVDKYPRQSMRLTFHTAELAGAGGMRVFLQPMDEAVIEGRQTASKRERRGFQPRSLRTATEAAPATDTATDDAAGDAAHGVLWQSPPDDDAPVHLFTVSVANVVNGAELGLEETPDPASGDDWKVCYVVEEEPVDSKRSQERVRWLYRRAEDLRTQFQRRSEAAVAPSRMQTRLRQLGEKGRQHELRMSDVEAELALRLAPLAPDAGGAAGADGDAADGPADGARAAQSQPA
ncbi:mitochondrial protein Pet127-domain-containing protein [Dipodascopsis tothii]|uniref:mitochondrial protein Pet127-domain-containing protein n=1 Tax=Dipodascopsis tothii TaxID=44089 RepID=UPI0034CF64E6